MILFVFLLILIGLVTGVLSGLLGIGGGIITVPALYYIFYFYGLPQEELMRVASATSLAATFLTSLGSAWAHHKKLSIVPSILKLMIPGLIFGCLIGGTLSPFLSGSLLRNIFGSMALVFAIYFFFPKLPPLNIAPSPNLSLMALGAVFGCLSTLLGIGGGIFMVPALLGYHVSLKNTVATSSVGTLTTALIGSLSYLVISWGNDSVPYAFGYIHVPAFLSIGIGSLFTSFLGVKWVQNLPVDLMKRIFACVLGATALMMLVGK